VWGLDSGVELGVQHVLSGVEVRKDSPLLQEASHAVCSRSQAALQPFINTSSVACHAGAREHVVPGCHRPRARYWIGKLGWLAGRRCGALVGVTMDLYRE
jgi:hypothetical protein